MPIGTAVHERTLPLCTSLNYREWSGFYAVSVYETHHEHEYNAIRNAAALIDVTPLFKYLITGRDATRFVNRVLARDINKVAVNQVIYCCWCDEDGKVIDDGTITRLEEKLLSLDCRRSEPAMVSAERNRPRRADRRHHRATGGSGAAGPDFGQAAEERRRSRYRELEILPQD